MERSLSMKLRHCLRKCNRAAEAEGIMTANYRRPFPSAGSAWRTTAYPCLPARSGPSLMGDLEAIGRPASRFYFSRRMLRTLLI